MAVIDLDDIEKNIRRWNAVSPMIAVALLDELRHLKAENESLRALLEQHNARMKRAKTL